MVAHEHKAGVIVVTHDHRALDVFDRILEMEDGSLRPSTTGGQGERGGHGALSGI